MIGLQLHRFALALLLAVPPLAPKIGSTSLESLVRRSDTIVIGRVERVVTFFRDLGPIQGEVSLDGSSQEEIPIAVVSVLETLKGPRETHTICYVARSSGICDNTTAEVGETALLFLGRATWMSSEEDQMWRERREDDGHAPMCYVMHAGRGRMPLRDSTHVSSPREVELPPSLMKLAAPQPGYTIVHTLPLADLRAEIIAVIARWTPILHAEQQGGSKEARWRLDVWSDGRARLYANGYDHFKVDPERLAELWRMFDTEHFSQLPTQLAPAGKSGEWRTLELETAAGRHMVRWSADDPGSLPTGDRASDLASVLRLWIHVRGLVNDPKVLDTREQDRALLERLR